LNWLAFAGGCVKKIRAGQDSARCFTKKPTSTQKKNSIMNDSTNNAAAMGMGIGVLLFMFVIGLAVYVFFCFCQKRICENAA
jgi:predicted transporter